MSLRFGVFVLAAITLRPAAGLDPSRTLTQYAHRIWQAQQGLPQGTIYSILQTHDGYLWLGSQTGLIRFDGVRFETLENIRTDVPQNVWVRSAMEDSHRALWIATGDAGLFRVDGDSVVHYSIKEGLPSDHLECLASAKNGDIWVCTSSGMARIRNGKAAAFLENQSIHAACEAERWNAVGGGRRRQSAFVGRVEVRLAPHAEAARRCGDSGA